MSEFNQMSLENEMRRITSTTGKIPSKLHIEMALSAQALSITKAVGYFDGNGNYKIRSDSYPGLEIIIKGTPGWHLE